MAGTEKLVHIQNSPIQNSPKNHAREGKKPRFAVIIGSKFCIKSYPLLASSQHVGLFCIGLFCMGLLCTDTEKLKTKKTIKQWQRNFVVTSFQKRPQVVIWPVFLFACGSDNPKTKVEFK